MTHSAERHNDELIPADEQEATKPAGTILRQEIAIGEEQLERKTSGLLLSAVSAGLDIGFAPLMVASVLAASPSETLASRLIGAMVYAIGFIIVIIGRSELFTEHTTLAVLPLLSGRTTVSRVARLWSLVYVGNIVGAASFAAVGAPLGVGLGLFMPADVARMSHHLTDFSTVVIFGSAIAAGWMMGLVSWLVTASRDTMAQILIILLVAGSIYFLHLHHSIAGSVEVLMGVFVGGVPFAEYLRFLGLATVGNAVGGIVFVALVKYGRVSASETASPRHS
ncbi:formate/nitrite transporter family protein [Gemmatimonas sp.]|uniref:formate/nitrite transporter family protein n=1 Tax=Gemmatimonas sp. TaxID=1962908 RepID=UPI003983C0E5